MERISSGWERLLAPAGFVYIVLHFIFLTLGSGPDATVRAVQSEFLRSPRLGMQRGTLFEVGALVLLLFAVSLWAHLRPAEAEPKTLSTLVLGTAFAALVLAFVGSAMLFVLEASVAPLRDATLTYSLLIVWWACFIGYSLLLGIMALAASTSALLTRGLPRWLGWLGMAAGLTLTGGCLAFYPSGAVVQGPADGVAYIGEILFVVWLAAAAIVVLRGRRVAHPISASTLAAEPAG